MGQCEPIQDIGSWQRIVIEASYRPSCDDNKGSDIPPSFLLRLEGKHLLGEVEGLLAQLEGLTATLEVGELASKSTSLHNKFEGEKR